MFVTPANAGVQRLCLRCWTQRPWIPAFAGMTELGDRANGETTLRVHASQPTHGTLYVGVTSALIKRVWEHKNGVVEGFTKRYQVHTLVWYEQHETMESAIQREKAIKEWKRMHKLEMIESRNPYWRDLYADLV